MAADEQRTWAALCRQLGRTPPPVEVEWVPDDRTLGVVVGGPPWSPDEVARATTYLTEALGVPVVLRFRAGAPSRAEQLLAADTPLKYLVTPDRVEDQGDRVVVRFPAPGSQEVFLAWGGVSRLMRTVPDLPPVVLACDEGAPLPEDPPVPLPPSPERFGRVAADPVTPLAAVPEAGPVTIRGRVFAVDRRALRDGGELVVIHVTDGSDSLTLRAFTGRGEPAMPALEAGATIRASGQMERDRSGEPVLRLAGWVVEPEPPPDDGAETARVEWHCHTKMSAMDSVLDIADLIARAAALGHPAVAVTDHGVVQSYPEAERLGREAGIRIIYGLEAYAVPDRIRLTEGAPPPPGEPAGWPVVAVDLETTGLSPRTHDIVEIGAVRIEGGDVVDRFQTLVRPRRRGLSDVARRMTGIRPEELEQAPDLEEAIAAFNRFAAGAVLVAHNAAFDLGFLRPYLAWEPTVVDTLAWARWLLPDQRSYGLDALTQLLKVPLQQHHRADHDAEAAGRVWWALLHTEAASRLLDRSTWAEAPVPPQSGRPSPVLIYPRNQDGLYALYRAVSASHLETFHRVPRVPWSTILAERDKWLVGAPVNGGELSELAFRGATDAEWATALARYDFVEVAPVAVAAAWLEDGWLGSADAVQDVMRELVARADSAGKPVVAVSDAHYLDPEDRVFRDILAATAKGDLHDATADLHFRTTGQMLAEMAFLGAETARRVVVDAPRRLLDTLSPIQAVPDGLHAPKLPDAEAVVSQVPWERARALFGDPLPELVEARLTREIDAIVRHGFASVYYTAHRLVRKSLQDGYLVGSRGSVGSSLVATLLDITEVNPLPPHYRCPACRWSEFYTDGRVTSGFDLEPRPCPQCGAPLIGDGQDIPFETFLGFEGDKVPDIDLNFSGEYQPVIHKYAEELFGPGQVFRAGTIATVADRTAYGLVRAWARERGKALRAAEVERLVRGIVGVKRTTGQHPGGLMVVPEDDDIHRFTPVQRPADAPDADVVTTHFDYHAIEGRLLKLDLLGHEDPTTLRMLEDLTGVPAREVPFHDPATLSLFSGTDALGLDPAVLGTPVGTLGIPEFGTPFVRRMLQDTKPKSFGELVRISGLSHGTNVWVSNAEELIKAGRASLSEVIATRDDIMTYLIRRGLEPHEAFQIMEQVRKGKGLKPAQEELMVRHGVPDWYIQSCRRITYMFPKAHAAAYVTMGWRIAWFKVHYPLQFYAVYCTIRADDFLPDVVLGGVEAIDAERARIERLGAEASAKDRSRDSLLEVVREMLLRGLGFLPVSLADSDAERFLPVGDRALRIPFVALPGLGRAAARSIVEARTQGPFLSVQDLRERARVTKPVLDLLRQHGALRGLGETRQLALF
jgi:DNA polymerase-3 subunit alpha (Gram-positive type)